MNSIDSNATQKSTWYTANKKVVSATFGVNKSRSNSGMSSPPSWANYDFLTKTIQDCENRLALLRMKPGRDDSMYEKIEMDYAKLKLKVVEAQAEDDWNAFVVANNDEKRRLKRGRMFRFSNRNKTSTGMEKPQQRLLQRKRIRSLLKFSTKVSSIKGERDWES
eukprot:CAMPEP_0172492072 /NCGR_PEP_ID=MMETSP1066-20121228/23066_1 /TAXON_ID=671091 /ORGANISM="Coscinodiscus wailesii, Strain CCMP2513" /LENGTH=163 /DNA_ID=CAMNT_0013261467 /DNA_START=62 /DNA_END=553 /DNA_ORIENTATION=+